jgi:CDP-diacylglycerol--glycerol-3-phosphate 3-phosphatidyltransferase
MKTFVNSLSIFRIAAAFAIIPLFLFQAHWMVLVLFAIAAATDFFDGWLAKKYGAASKIGGILDHIGDKLLIVNSAVMLAASMRVWFVIVPIILMIAREIYVSGLREFLGVQKMEMPVAGPRFSAAKIKTALQMISVGAFFLLIAIGSSLSPNIEPNKAFMYAMTALPYICMWSLWLALGASLWSAGTYTFDFAKKVKKMK